MCKYECNTLYQSVVSYISFFLAIDFTWLGLVAKKFYDFHLSQFSRTLNWPAALFVYLLIVASVVFISVTKYQQSGRLTDGFMWGAMAGLMMYGVYDLTNMATLSNWSWKLVVVDVLWGVFVCGVVGLIASNFSRVLT
ncbi:DUF2177 family protein [Patescibacteria group bacterium]